MPDEETKYLTRIEFLQFTGELLRKLKQEDNTMARTKKTETERVLEEMQEKANKEAAEAEAQANGGDSSVNGGAEVIDQNDLSNITEEEKPILQGVPMIYGQMIRIMADVNAIVKTKSSNGVPYKFRGIETVMNALHPILVKHQVFCIPIVKKLSNQIFTTSSNKTNFQAIMECAYRFYAVDGSSVEGVVAAESTDFSDKATQQAISYCFKTILLQTFCVPTEDTVSDGDEKMPDRQGSQPVNTQQRLPQQQQQRQQQPPPAQQPPPSPAVARAAADLAAGADDRMTPEAWAAIKALFSEWKTWTYENEFNVWTVNTLRENHLIVPTALITLNKEAGRILYKVAMACKERKEMLNVVPAEPAPAPAAEVPAETAPIVPEVLPPDDPTRI